MTNKNISSLFNDLKNESQVFLNYLKAKFPIFHNSNLFYRDFQYGVKSFLEKKVSLSQKIILLIFQNSLQDFMKHRVFL